MNLMNLKAKSIKSQLNFLETDLEYKKKMIEEEDKDFLIMMNNILDENPELKKMYYEKEDKIRENIINELSKKEDMDDIIDLGNEINDSEIDKDDIEDPIYDPINESDDYVTKDKDPKIKGLYRQIVKLSHPDKVDDPHLNSIYLESTEYYDNNNLYGIYTICDTLNIKYDIEESEILNMLNLVSSLEDKIGFIEGTYTWKWSNSPSEEIKKQVVIDFINMKLKRSE